jgi:hypothetical protein
VGPSPTVNHCAAAPAQAKYSVLRKKKGVRSVFGNLGYPRGPFNFSNLSGDSKMYRSGIDSIGKIRAQVGCFFMS